MKEDERDPIEALLRRAIANPLPTQEERERAQAALSRAIEAERVGKARYRRLTRLGLITSIPILLVVVALLLPTNSASAALGEMAAAAEQIDPLLIPEQSFAYSRSESRVLVVLPKDAFRGIEIADDQVAYLLPQTR